MEGNENPYSKLIIKKASEYADCMKISIYHTFKYLWCQISKTGILEYGTKLNLSDKDRKWLGLKDNFTF